MVKQSTKDEIDRIIKTYEKRGWKCRREVPTILKGKKMNESSLNRVDVCCMKKPRAIKCWELEDGPQFQTLKNARAMREYANEMRRKGFIISFCHMGSHEKSEEVC